MKATTTELNAGHLAMLSQPEAVATVILEAATKALGASVAPGHRGIHGLADGS